MGTRVINSSDRYPSDWAQLYALSYGELCTILDSFLEASIEKDDVRALYRRHVNVHAERCGRMVGDALREHVHKKLARPE